MDPRAFSHSPSRSPSPSTPELWHGIDLPDPKPQTSQYVGMDEVAGFDTDYAVDRPYHLLNNSRDQTPSPTDDADSVLPRLDVVGLEVFSSPTISPPFLSSGSLHKPLFDFGVESPEFISRVPFTTEGEGDVTATGEQLSHVDSFFVRGGYLPTKPKTLARASSIYSDNTFGDSTLFGHAGITSALLNFREPASDHDERDTADSLALEPTPRVYWLSPPFGPSTPPSRSSTPPPASPPSSDSDDSSDETPTSREPSPQSPIARRPAKAPARVKIARRTRAAPRRVATLPPAPRPTPYQISREERAAARAVRRTNATDDDIQRAVELGIIGAPDVVVSDRVVKTVSVVGDALVEEATAPVKNEEEEESDSSSTFVASDDDGAEEDDDDDDDEYSAQPRPSTSRSSAPRASASNGGTSSKARVTPRGPPDSASPSPSSSSSSASTSGSFQRAFAENRVCTQECCADKPRIFARKSDRDRHQIKQVACCPHCKQPLSRPDALIRHIRGKKACLKATKEAKVAAAKRGGICMPSILARFYTSASTCLHPLVPANVP